MTRYVSFSDAARVSTIICALLTGVLAVPAQCLAENGLVAMYTFEGEDGVTATDAGPYGHDATIQGAVRVPSPRGRALRFDGVDDYVHLETPEHMVLAGDLTIEAWVKATDVSGRNRMIFGDAAGLTVNRNYNLRVDKGKLRFEFGNGTDYGIVVDEDPFTVDEWHHVAVVCEQPWYLLYVDGIRKQTVELPVSITATKGGARLIGGWFAGHFKGDIDEVRLYRRALRGRELYEHYSGGPAGWERWAEFGSEFHMTRQAMLPWVLCGGISAKGCAARFALTAKQTGRVIHRRAEPLRQTRPNSERWTARVRLSTAGLKAADYVLQTTVVDRGGGTVSRHTHEFEFLTSPDWLGSREGLSDEVLPPFTALKVDRAQETVSVAPWGRRYEFGPGFPPSQIGSSGQPLLAAPVRIEATVDAGKVAWDAAAPQVVSFAPQECVVSQELAGDGARLSTETTVAYDGLMKIHWRLKSVGARRVDRLAVEIPLRASVAKYFYTWPNPRSGALIEDIDLPFKPIVWLGDDARGLTWVCESAQNWYPGTDLDAIQVIRGDEEVMLRINLITAPTELGDGEELSYTFGLQATPVKPVEQDAWDYRIVRHPWYGKSFSLPELKVGDTPALDHFAKKGARVLINWRWWDVFSHVEPIGHEDEFKALVKTCHDHGLKVIPYVGGFLLSDRAPEAPFFKHDMSKTPLTTFPLSMPGLPTQTGYIVCQRSCWQDFLVDGIARLIDEYDVDGVYLDSTTIPWGCMNQLHGCGYRRPDGSLGTTYPVFDVRENLKRIYTAVKQRKPDGIVDVHVYDCMNSPALAYATTYWNGEQLKRGAELKTDALPLDRFRTEFMGYNWGVPADLLYYVMGGNRQSWAIALLHDVPVRSENLKDLDTQASLWDLREKFGCKQADWLPYWNNGEYAQVAPEGCHASLYRHPDGRVLVYVSNLTKEDAPVSVGLDMERLGLGEGAVARDGISGAAIELSKGTLRLYLPSQDWRAIWVEGAGE